MRAHQMNGEVIANTIEVESLEVFPSLIDAAIGGAIGDRIVAGVVVPKPTAAPIVPEAVTMRQARLALLQAGLLPSVNAAVSGMTGPSGEAARIEWEYSSEVQRHKALVVGLGLALGLSDAQLDALFLTAAAL